MGGERVHKVDGGWGGNLLGKSLRSRGLDLATLMEFQLAVVRTKEEFL